MFIQSPNYTKGRGGKPASLIIIHWFGVGTIDGAIASFQNPAREASAHYLISDSRLVQMVDEGDTAWHAGVYAVNQISIGIEHDANPDKQLSEASYQTSGKLVREICARHSIPIDREHIKGHNEIKATQCPGTIDINKIIEIAKGGSNMDKFHEFVIATIRRAREVMLSGPLDNPGAEADAKRIEAEYAAGNQYVLEQLLFDVYTKAGNYQLMTKAEHNTIMAKAEADAKETADQAYKDGAAGVVCPECPEQVICEPCPECKPEIKVITDLSGPEIIKFGIKKWLGIA